MRVIAADKILADFGHRFWSALRAAPEPKSKIFARISSLLKGAKSSYAAHLQRSLWTLTIERVWRIVGSEDRVVIAVVTGAAHS